MAQFPLKIELLSHIMGTTPILEMARAYGLRPRLWLLVLRLIFRSTEKIGKAIMAGKKKAHYLYMQQLRYTVHCGLTAINRETLDSSLTPLKSNGGLPSRFEYG